MKSNNEVDAAKIFNRAIEFFKYKKEYSVEDNAEMCKKFPSSKKLLKLRKIGSDLTFELTVGELAHSYLKVFITERVEKGFAKKVLGTLEYKATGACENKRKVCLPHKRQQAELAEVIDHIECSLRPNSINFIMGD